MEKYLKEIKSALSKHRESYSFYLCSDKGSDWTTPLQHPLYLDADKHYEIALISLETFYSIPNIREDNNKLVYSRDTGRTWETIEIPIGSYEIDQLNAAIRASTPNRDAFRIAPNLATLCTVFFVTDINYKVDMSKSSIRTVLGFNEQNKLGKPNILEAGRYQSDNVVNIFDIANIFCHCDLVSGSYFKGDLSSVVYSFFPAVGVGHKIIQRPSQPLYLPISKRGSINRIRLWITDQNGKLIDFREEDITVRLHIRSI